MKPAADNIDPQAVLLDRLQATLEMQIDMARKSDFRSIEALSDQTRLIITEIAEKGIFQQPKFKDRHTKLIKLCQKLELMVATSKDNVEKQLRKVSKGKKTMQAYRHRS